MADRDEVLAAVQQWTGKPARRDWTMLFALLTDDAVVSSPALEQPIIGREALDAWTEAWEDDLSDVDVE